LQQCFRTFFSKSVFKFDIAGFKVGQKTQNLTGKFFLLSVCGYCREKILRILGRDGQTFGHLVQSVKLFLDKGLLIKGQIFSPNPRSGVGFCRKKNSKNSGRDGQHFGDLVQPVTKDLRDHSYAGVLPQ
jgi:hypothetical protein